MHVADLTDAQRQLREMISQWPVADQTLEQHPERPSWANRAFVFVGPDQIPELQDMLHNEGITLQSKHMVVSSKFKKIVQELLDAGPLGSGRDAFLRSRTKVCRVQELAHGSDGSDVVCGNEGRDHISDSCAAVGEKDEAKCHSPGGMNCGEAESTQDDSKNSGSSNSSSSSSSCCCCRKRGGREGRWADADSDC